MLSNNSSNTAALGLRLTKCEFSLGCLQGDVPLPPRPDTQLALEPALEPAEEG